MANQDLLNYITNSKRSGIGEDKMRQNLKDTGWQEADINDAFNSADNLKSPSLLSKKNIVIGSLVLLVTIGASSYYFLFFNSPNLQPSDATPSSVVKTEPSSSVQPSVVPTTTPVAYQEILDVSWEKAWLLQPAPSCAPNDYNCGSSNFYLVGKVLSGTYVGQSIYIEEIQSMGTYYSHYVIQNNEIKYLDDLKIGLKGVNDIPDFINFPVKFGYRLKKSYVSEPFDAIKKVRKVFTDPILGDFYLTEEGCFVVELPDHLALSYDIDITFANTENGALNITFIDGSKNNDYYTFNELSCFSQCYYLSFVEDQDIKSAESLIRIGTASNNEDVYGIKDPNDPELKKIYEDKNTVAYYTDDYQQIPQNKYTYEQFIAANPLIYWKDPLGRWVEFRNNKFIIAAEMCKPVIYLYPEKATELTVKVHPNGGFTLTEPLYNNGWQVIAYPGSKIKDVRTGKMYDYLFWEGIGLNYPELDEGWSVKREDLKSFFDEKLTMLGLNQRELNDFEDYWLNRLSEKPFYKISFLQKEIFDRIAPLELSERPDVVIRIMMTARGLDQPTSLNSQEFNKAKARTGFTLVEWGGVLLK